jgi:hypothetical protein
MYDSHFLITDALFDDPTLKQNSCNAKTDRQAHNPDLYTCKGPSILDDFTS